MFIIMTSTVVVGGFFGDEGKGKIISYLAIKDDPKIIVRGGAGPCLLYTSPSPRDRTRSRMPSSA